MLKTGFKAKAAVIAAAVAGLAGAGQASASTITYFNDFGPGYAHNTNISTVISTPSSGLGRNNWVMDGFAAEASGPVSSIDLALYNYDGSDQVLVELLGTQGVNPYLGSWTVTDAGNLFDPCCKVATIDPKGVSLVQGETYYIRISGLGDTWSDWSWNSTGATGVVSTAYGTQTTTLQAFDVLGSAGVPEPATWALMIIGLGMIGFAARRRSGGVAVAA